MTENRAQDVMLAAHELAANAVRHGAGAGRLQMRAGDGMLRVQVHDAGPASRTGQAGTAGLDEQDIPGGGDGGWPLRLDDPVFFEPFAPHFHPVLGRPSTPVECYLRLMFLKFRYRLGYESLCAEVSDSISWRRFCRIGLDAKCRIRRR